MKNTIESLDSEVNQCDDNELISDIGHELRTPLNSIIGFSGILQQELFGALNEKQKGYVNYITESGEYLLRTINAVVDLLRVKSGSMEINLTKFLLKDVVNTSIEMFREKIVEHNLILNLVIKPEADIEIEADKEKLKIIMSNLLSNAVKFTKDGGAIRLTVRKPNNEHIEISVKDTGVGIKPGDADNIFKPFALLDSNQRYEDKGTGTGLALTKGLVELHKGEIFLESEFGKGSNFVIILPLKL